MQEVSIPAEKRNLEIKPKHLREEGLVMGVIYGHDFESMPVQFDYQTFRKAYRITGDSTVMVLEVEGKKYATLVHDVSYEPVSGTFLHVDFLAVNEKETIKAHIPLVLEGLSPAVKNLTAVLVTPINMIEVECLPKHLVKEIIVDVTSLVNFHDTIHVSDLEISANNDVTVLTPAETTVVTAATPKGYGHTKTDEEETAAEETPAAE